MIRHKDEAGRRLARETARDGLEQASTEPALDAPSDDVVAALLEDHGRTRAVVRRALLLTRETSPSGVASVVAKEMHEFFGYWSPLHEIDEELTVAPAVAAHVDTDVGREVLARLTRDHEMLDALRAEVGAMWSALAVDPRAVVPLHAPLRVATRELAQKLATHVAWEEREFFPLIRARVPSDVRAAVLAVMRRRRATPHGEGTPER